MGNQTIVKYVTQMRREEGVQKRQPYFTRLISTTDVSLCFYGY